jgi:hypothetical protein
MPRKERGVTVVKQRHDFDCGIAALAGLFNKPYGDVAAIVKDRVDSKKLRKRGMIIADMQLVAEQFEHYFEVIWRKKDYLTGKTGILGLKGGKMDKAGHWVLLKEGTVIADPDDGKLYSVEEYLKIGQCRTTLLLIPKKL